VIIPIITTVQSSLPHTMASGVAKHPYVAPTDGNKGNFLEFKQGDKIEDIKLLDGGWWYGSVASSTPGGKRVCGYFPSTYISLNERNPSGKQAAYDGGALRRSNSKSVARMMSIGSTDGSSNSASGGAGAGGGQGACRGEAPSISCA
jgi:hypothetical protein